MVMLYVALFFAGLEMVVYLPPSVFTSDLCAAPDNFTLSLVPSDNANLAEYVTYYIYCANQSAAANPLLPYTQEAPRPPCRGDSRAHAHAHATAHAHAHLSNACHQVRAALAEVDPLLATLQNYSSVAIAAKVSHPHLQQSLRNWIGHRCRWLLTLFPFGSRA